MRVLIVSCEAYAHYVDKLGEGLRVRNVDPEAIVATSCEAANDILQAYTHDGRSVFQAVIVYASAENIEFIPVLRRVYPRVGILVLGTGNVTECCCVLRAGADDYQPVDINLREMATRVVAIVRRYHGASTAVLECGPLHFDLKRCCVMVDGYAHRHKGAIQTRLLETLVFHPGAVLSAGFLLLSSYGFEHPSEAALGCQIWYLRQFLSDLGFPYYTIVTVRGRGFMIDLDAKKFKRRPNTRQPETVPTASARC